MNGLTNGGEFRYIPFYGRLPVISREDYFEGDWEYVGTDFDDFDEDVEEYSVCYSQETGSYACVLL